MQTALFRILREIGACTAKALLCIRLALGALGVVGGLLTPLLFFVDLGLTWNHGHGVPAGTLFGPGARHGRYYLASAGHHTVVSARLYWTVWAVEIAAFSGAWMMALMFAIEGLVWLAGGESYVWGRRRCSDPDGEGTKFNDNG